MIAVVFSIIGAYHYLRIVKLMYFDDPDDTSPPIACGQDTRLVLSFSGLAVLLVLGSMPGLLMTLRLAAMSGAS